MMKSRFLFLALTFVCVACIPFLSIAGDVIFREPPVNAPFDGGLSLLVAAGIGYASKKAYQKRKNDKMQAQDVK
jgi:hypothetical protein